MEILEKFKEELEEDTKIDQMNVLDKQMMHPANRHKWVARLIYHKRYKNKLERKKKSLKEEVLKNLIESGIPSGIPKSSINGKVESSEVIQKINQEIEDMELMIDYLERVEKIFASMTFDYSNIVKLIAFETT